MGINGLLKFCEEASRETHVSEFKGGTAAIDISIWLHLGAHSCADKLVLGQKTKNYVYYCMRYVDMLRSHNIKPILVFDGGMLPAKEVTYAKRRILRDEARKKAIELMEIGEYTAAKKLFKKAVTFTHEASLELIKLCQKFNIDCIVAPYEADAQLAYLNLSGIADVVITNDQDLMLFGCKKVFFKMDIKGNGVLVVKSSLYRAMNLKFKKFKMDKLLYMSILSGCDYLSPLPGIGLSRAKEFIEMNTGDNIYQDLTRLSSSLKMKDLVVTKKYRDSFIQAVIAFKHQLVFCPLQRKQVRLTPPPPNITKKQLYYAGQEHYEALAFQLALGNCDPCTHQMLHDYNPDALKRSLGGNNRKHKGQRPWFSERDPVRPSIWSRESALKNEEGFSPRQTNSGHTSVDQHTVLATIRLAALGRTPGYEQRMKTHIY